jgi:glycosyltransferase involved in cell wall biosynthesis
MKFNKHIVILTPGFPAGGQDTTCIPPLQAYVGNFTKIHPEIKLSIITFQYPFSHKKYKWKSVEVYACGGKNRKLPYKLIIWNRVRKYFKEINKSHRIDLIHSFWLFDCALIGNRLAKKIKAHHIITLMGQDAKPDNKYLRWINLKKCTTVCLSENHKAIFQKTSGISDSEIIPWGIDPSDFPFSKKNKKEIDIIGVGSFIELKNYLLFVKIIEKLKQSHDNIKAILVGGGVQQEMLQNEIIKRGLENNIQIKEQLPRKDALDLMSKSKILLHTSIYESQAYVFYEAMQLGLKIVSFDIGVAKSSANWSVAKNEDELFKGVKQFLNKPSEANVGKPPLISETINRYYKLIEEKIEEK